MTRPLTKLISLCSVLFIVTGCATHVELNSTFPKPLSKPLPLRSVVVFDDDFRNYRFENTEGRDVSITVGQTQVDLFTAITSAMFRETTFANTLPTNAQTDLVVRPKVEDVQISMPFQTKLNVFEVWIKYNMQVFDRDNQPIADWIMSAYGKTPTKFLKSDSEALHQAAVVALRDAGAHFIIGFARVPEIRAWLARSRQRKPDTTKLPAKTVRQKPPVNPQATL